MKVLIVSHNCFSTTQSMGKTFASLFSEFAADELMQLYLYPTLPNTAQCTNLFRITDREILNSLQHHNQKCGRVIHPDEIKSDNALYENSAISEAYQKTRNAELLARRARDVMWALGNWKSEALKSWLLEGKPDVVFYALGDAIFSQNIAMWVADFLKIPMVTYVCDEFYYYYRHLRNPFARMLCVPLARNIKKTIMRSTRLVTICEEQGEAYEKTFGVPYTTIMTGSSFPAGSLGSDENAKQVSYIGNLALNRWKSMQEIATVLKQINKELNEDYKLVYYGSKNNHLDGFAEYGGRLNPAQIQEVMNKSRLLIHTESFDEEYRDRLRYSISTKIADSLASGNCLFAYGPEELASFHYLHEQGCAFVCGSKVELYDTLVDALRNNEHRQTRKEKAYESAKKYHDSRVNSEKLKNVLESYESSASKLCL